MEKMKFTPINYETDRDHQVIQNNPLSVLKLMYLILSSINIITLSAVNKLGACPVIMKFFLNSSEYL